MWWFSSRSHQYFQNQQPKSAAAEMDLSVLYCLGPDFDTQTVYSLFSDGNYPDATFTQSHTANWWMSSPSQWNHALTHEVPIYTPVSVMSELGPQSPTSSVAKRPFSDVTNRTTSKKKATIILFCFHFLTSRSTVFR